MGGIDEAKPIDGSLECFSRLSLSRSLTRTSSLSASAWSLSTAGARSPEESALRNMIAKKEVARRWSSASSLFTFFSRLLILSGEWSGRSEQVEREKREREGGENREAKEEARARTHYSQQQQQQKKKKRSEKTKRETPFLSSILFFLRGTGAHEASSRALRGCATQEEKQKSWRCSALRQSAAAASA